MYFSLIPDIEYDTKPISYPFSESEYTIAKNFFRRYKIDDDVFGYATFYQKYSIKDGIKLETIAANYYGNAFYDWVIVLTNNLINPLFSFPLDNYTLNKSIESRYGTTAHSEIHHYETIETKTGQSIDGLPVIALKGGLIVDENFYTKPFTYWNGTQHITVNGNTVSKPISIYENEVAENEKKREIYILKKRWFAQFVEEFKVRNLYTESSDFISKRLKKTGTTF